MKIPYIIVALFALVFVTACGNEPTFQDISTTPMPDQILEIPSEPEETYSSDAGIETPTVVETQDLSTATPLPTLPPTATLKPQIPMPLIGSEPHNPEQETVLTLLSNSGAQIVRLNSVVWYKVEPQEGQYNWAALRNLDFALAELASRDIDVILIIRGTPGWAQKLYGTACGPISELKFQAFADFMSELVRRYSAPPYNVKYWELGNEPDVAPELVAADSVFGCWGDSQDPNYGGGYYAEMLKIVYPTIKIANPNAQVLIGGLLLDCDPYYPPEGKDCVSARFFNGILANGGADFFDIVSFHGYPPYVRNSFSMDWEFPGWKERGGVVVGKINYLREVMQQYGIHKPLFLTESSLNCPEWNKLNCRPPDGQFFQAQADYLVRLFIRNWALDISGTVWYDFEGQGWRYGGLVGVDPSMPKLSYQAFKFMNEKLAGMVFTGEVPHHEGIQGYVFSGDNRKTWVLWSQDASPQRLDLNSEILSASDIFGESISLDEDQLAITSPVYLDLVP